MDNVNRAQLDRKKGGNWVFGTLSVLAGIIAAILATQQKSPDQLVEVYKRLYGGEDVPQAVVESAIANALSIDTTYGEFRNFADRDTKKLSINGTHITLTIDDTETELGGANLRQLVTEYDNESVEYVYPARNIRLNFDLNTDVDYAQVDDGFWQSNFTQIFFQVRFRNGMTSIGNRTFVDVVGQYYAEDGRKAALLYSMVKNADGTIEYNIINEISSGYLTQEPVKAEMNSTVLLAASQNAINDLVDPEHPNKHLDMVIEAMRLIISHED